MIVDEPHPFVTVVVGVDGIATGEAVAEAGGLEQPETVCVTV